MAQQREGRWVGPVEVVEHNQKRHRRRSRTQPAGDRLEQASALRFRVGTHRRGFGYPSDHFGHEPDELTRKRPEPTRRRDIVREFELEAQCLDERLEREPEVLVTAAGQHQRLVIASNQGELGRQARLAHTRLPCQQHHATRAGRGFLPLHDQPLEDLGAARQGERRW